MHLYIYERVYVCMGGLRSFFQVRYIYLLEYLCTHHIERTFILYVYIRSTYIFNVTINKFCAVVESCISGLLQVVCSGVFELRLKSFINENGKDHLGQCCGGERHGRCTTPCHTRFRVCLKHFQNTIDTTSACTFGDVMTPVLGENNVHLGDSATNVPGFSNPIRFPFDFSWPVSCQKISYVHNLCLVDRPGVMVVCIGKLTL